MKWFSELWNGVYIEYGIFEYVLEIFEYTVYIWITPDIANFDPDIASSQY